MYGANEYAHMLANTVHSTQSAATVISWTLSRIEMNLTRGNELWLGYKIKIAKE